MYILTFRKNASKNFYEALTFARDLGGDFDGQLVTIKVNEENLLSAYSTFRTLFGLIQSWKSTRATYRGKPVHPYRFILKMHRIKDCVLSDDCGQNWNCKKLDDINHKEHRIGLSWFNIGYFKEEKWILNKTRIKELLLGQSELLGVDICPSFDETELLTIVRDLPDYIVPDNVYYKITYKEKKIQGQTFIIKDNIEQLKKEPIKRILII